MSGGQSEVRVGLVGCGSMGCGIALQLDATPGMKLLWVADRNAEAAVKAGALAACPASTDPLKMLEKHPIDVLVEATNSIGAAARYCFAAIESRSHVVLMNAEVDLALGPLLAHEARRQCVVVTSDAGDQHGVLASMIMEADLMGFDVVQAGNIKGFLDRRATPASLVHEAAKRRLSPEQCCAYTDGTKLHIEMAVLANGFGYLPPIGGMTGPRAHSVHEVPELFDFATYEGTPRVDYILGAEPGGGVYLVVRPKVGLSEEQRFYLGYYKLGAGPWYLLYRPYHLCHLETPKAILSAVRGQPILAPGQYAMLLGAQPRSARPTCQVFARAKRDLRAGETLQQAIGSEACYGTLETADTPAIPIVLLEDPVILHKPVARDEFLTSNHLDLPDSDLLRWWRQQEALLDSCV